jgi:hypothetical protein
MIRKAVARLNARLNPPLHDPLMRPLMDAFQRNGIRLPTAIVGSPPLSMHVTGSGRNQIDITLTYRVPSGLGWWEGVGIGSKAPPDDGKGADPYPFGPRHKSAGDESAEKKAEEIREWMNSVPPLPRPGRLGP